MAEGVATAPDGRRGLVLWVVAIGGALGFAFLLAMSIVANQRANAARDNATAWTIHTYQVIVAAEQLRSALFDAQRGMRGFLIARDDAFLEPYDNALAQFDPLTQKLRSLTRDSAKQQDRLTRLATVIATQRARMMANVVDAHAGRLATVLAQVRSRAGEDSMSTARVIIQEVVDRERGLLAQREAAVRAADAAAQAAGRSLALLGGILLITSLIAGIVSARAWLSARTAAADVAEATRARTLLEAAVAERTAEIAATNAALSEEIVRTRAAENQVRQMQKLESIGQLTGGIAHDFNNMLAIVIGSIDLATRRLVDPTGKVLGYLDNAMDGARRAAALTAKLLAFSRQQALAPSPIEPNTFVASISELLRRTLGEGVIIETVLAGGLWRAYVDPGELENAILNLAVNARDAMDGKGKLTIETANTHLDDAYAALHDEVTPGQYVVVCVTDTGGGMPPEVIARAFDPFYTTKTVGKGTGLGLSQVYGFVRQSGGHVKIYSEIGQGTTVKIYMPRWTGADAAPNLGAAPLDELPRASEGETIFVVEDEERVRLVTVDTLRDLGYTIAHAANGEEALKLLEQQPRVDLLFTDIVMPGMTGRELADAALARRPGLKVLYTTGYTKNAVVHNGMLDAQVAFLAKPFTVEGLAIKVRTVLDGGGINRPVA